jgi:PIN domain nuclease of toxin-antitoxin system
VRLLLDTHILLGFLDNETDRFPAAIRDLIADPESRFFVSVASLWEAAIKFRLGKLPLRRGPESMPGAVRDLGFELIAINEHHAVAEVSPEPVTRDPFDRLLLAQCLVEGLRLVTVDRALVGHRLAAV